MLDQYEGQINGEEFNVVENVDTGEADSILESISCGKVLNHKKLSFQAICAAISHKDQVQFVFDYLVGKSEITDNRFSKFTTAKNKVLAYRVT